MGSTARDVPARAGLGQPVTTSLPQRRLVTADHDSAINELPAVQLSPPSFTRLVRFHLPIVLRSAEVTEELLGFVPRSSDSAGVCQRKLDALIREAFVDCHRVAGHAR